MLKTNNQNRLLHRPLIGWLIGIIALCTTAIVHADGVQSLNNFLKHRRVGFSADFTQVVYGHKKNQLSSGSLVIMPPNKFRWQYNNDNQNTTNKDIDANNNINQLIVSDGNKIYIYDPLLQQLTLKPLQGSIGKTPASILAGNDNIHALYKVTNNDITFSKVWPANVSKELVRQLSWVLLELKKNNDSSNANNNGFNKAWLGFDSENIIAAMLFVDSFGNRSQINFTHFKSPASIQANTFKFTITKNMDVIDASTMEHN